MSKDKTQLVKAIRAAMIWLRLRGYEIPGDVLQAVGDVKVDLRRDPREPGREEKERMEKRLMAVIARRFKKQRDILITALENHHPERKTAADLDNLINPDEYWTDDEYEAELANLIIAATRGGIALFGKKTPLQIDYTLTNAEAAAAARKYAYELVKNINQTTKDALQKAISAFVETPGMTIGDLVDLLPFDEQRALRVATTEITRAYATGQQVAGEALAKEFPDVEVIKIWFTNEDDRVCIVCLPLDGKEVGIDEEFDTDISNPPAHVNCRCWTETTTKIA